MACRNYRFFAEDFFAADFLEALFFELAEERLPAAVLLAPFFALDRFLCGFGGMFAPDLRASLNPIAMACFGFLTFLWLGPDSSS